MVTSLMIETGELGPSITILGIHKEDGKNAIVHIPIMEKFMKNEDSKDKFVEEVLPGIAKNIRQDFDIHAVIWAAEAWMRISDTRGKDPEELLVNWKSIPIKKEVLIISIESENKTEFTIKEITRKGKQVNEDGELIDKVELIDLEEYNNTKEGIIEGRFTGLYKKFKGYQAEL